MFSMNSSTTQQAALDPGLWRPSPLFITLTLFSPKAGSSCSRIPRKEDQELTERGGEETVGRSGFLQKPEPLQAHEV